MHALHPEEHKMRKEFFVKNMLLVETLNEKHAGTATFKANHFMDMSKDEIMSFRGGVQEGINSKGNIIGIQYPTQYQ